MKYEQQAAIATRHRSPTRLGRKPLSFSGLMIYMAVLALITGFGSTWWLLSGAFPFSRERAGAWLYWPDLGSANVDPYALAMINRDAMLPLGGGDGIELLATRDTAGQPLTAACSYRLGPAAPHARFWSLGAYGARGNTLTTELGRTAFTSSEVVRNEDGSFAITLARNVEAGNWLPLAAQGRFVLVLRLYDVPATGGRTTVEPQLLPKIERLECQP